MNNSKNLSIFLIILIVALGVGIYYMTFNKSPKAEKQTISNSLSSNTGSSPSLGYTKAQNLAKNYSSLVIRTTIQQQINGKLKAKGENSWTIENKGQVLTLTQTDKKRKISFSSLPASSSAGVKPVEINPEAIQVGDTIFVTQGIDFLSGESTIYGILVRKSLPASSPK